GGPRQSSIVVTSRVRAGRGLAQAGMTSATAAPRAGVTADPSRPPGRLARAEGQAARRCGRSTLPKTAGRSPAIVDTGPGRLAKRAAAPALVVRRLQRAHCAERVRFPIRDAPELR